MNFNFLYGIDRETERVKNTLNKLDFYKQNNYQISFPNNFDLTDNNFEYIKSCISNEYNNNDYLDISNFLNKKILENKNEIEIAFSKTDFKPDKEYIIFLTKYGVGGSYNTPNEIIINFKIKEKEKLLKTIVHETIHLCINDYIIKYNIPHWEKELLVDLFFDRILQKLNILQKINLNLSRIDEIKKIFLLNFPNTENIIKKMRGIV